MRAFFILAISCACGIAAETTPLEASYRVMTMAGSTGSGTGIAPKVCVTNAHVAPRVNSRVTLTNHLTGDRIRGHVFAVDRHADLSLIMADRELAWVRANPDGIRDDQTATKLGYGGSGRLALTNCRLIHRDSQFADGYYATLSVPSIPGDSGGGVFQNGRLVAVVWGSSDLSGTDPNGTTVAAEAGYIQRLAARVDQKYNTPVHSAIFGFG